MLFAGRGGGTIQTGRHIQLGQETPMTNLYMAMLDKMGVLVERIGDSTGKLKELS